MKEEMKGKRVDQNEWGMNEKVVGKQKHVVWEKGTKWKGLPLHHATQTSLALWEEALIGQQIKLL